MSGVRSLYTPKTFDTPCGAAPKPDKTIQDMKQKPATASRNYVQFIQARDQALEKLLNKTQAQITDLSRGVFLRVLEILATSYGVMAHETLITRRTREMLQAIDHELDLLFQRMTPQFVAIIHRMKAHSYMLSLVGEAEAIGRAMNQPSQYEVYKSDTKKAAEQSREGDDLNSRIIITFDRLRRQILNGLELSFLKKENTAQMLKRVYAKLPKKRIVKRPPRELTKVIREADQQGDVSLAVGFISQDDWDALVKDYKTDYVPEFRSPETLFMVADPSDETKLTERYGWEIEQEAADEFVRTVREGQSQAAQQNGISDFVWIAVIDDKTDECCSWRDSLTSTEIETQLKGKHKNDECQAIVPPAHFNCRCSLAPMLDDMPEAEPSNLETFERWLES